MDFINQNQQTFGFSCFSHDFYGRLLAQQQSQRRPNFRLIIR